MFQFIILSFKVNFGCCLSLAITQLLTRFFCHLGPRKKNVFGNMPALMKIYHGNKRTMVKSLQDFSQDCSKILARYQWSFNPGCESKNEAERAKSCGRLKTIKVFYLRAQKQNQRKLLSHIPKKMQKGLSENNQLTKNIKKCGYFCFV